MDQSNQRDSWMRENCLPVIPFINNLTVTTTPASAVKGYSKPTSTIPKPYLALNARFFGRTPRQQSFRKHFHATLNNDIADWKVRGDTFDCDDDKSIVSIRKQFFQSARADTYQPKQYNGVPALAKQDWWKLLILVVCNRYVPPITTSITIQNSQSA